MNESPTPQQMQQPDSQQQQYTSQSMPQQPSYINNGQPNPRRKRLNVIAMVGLGLILLAICIFGVSPQIAIYAWFFGFVFSIAGLFFKPRWMAVIGTIIGSVPILFLLVLVLNVNNPGPPSAEQLERMGRELIDKDVVVDSLVDDEAVVDELLLDPVEANELNSSDSTAEVQPVR